MQGQVLNLTSAWWMENTQHIVRNALLEVPHPNVSIMQGCKVFPVEVVVRGFMTGMPPQIRPKTSMFCIQQQSSAGYDISSIPAQSTCQHIKLEGI